MHFLVPVKPFTTLTSLLFCAVFFSSCSGDTGSKHVEHKVVSSSKHRLFEEEDFSKTISAAFPQTADTGKRNRGIQSAATAVRYVYAAHEWKPLWLAEDGITDWAESLIAELDSLRSDGIAPERYGLPELTASLSRLKQGGDLDAAIQFDTSCTRAWLQASRDLLLGVIQPRRADSLWFHVNDSVWNGPDALAKADAYPRLAQYRSSIPAYAALRAEWSRYAALKNDATLDALKTGVTGKSTPDSTVQAIINRELPWIQPLADDSLSNGAQYIRALQEHYSLAPTGKKDSSTLSYLRLSPDTILSKIAANMERLRWLPNVMENQYVLVNIPQMELQYRKDGADAFGMRVVVGRPSRQTPVLGAMMANVVFSPSWGVPPTILKKDVLPGFTKSGGAYLEHKGLHIYDRHGHQVSASSVSARNLRNYTLKQPPGEHNALGEVKFNLPNPWDIYLHDTPHRGDFPLRYRAKSSGCVRVEKPREFAEFILRDIEGREQFDQMKIDSIIQLRTSRFEQLKTKIPVHILYLTAFEDAASGHVRMTPDIYGRDRKLMATLAAL